MASQSRDERILVVLMNGTALGEVYQDRSGGVRLRYDEAYAATPGAVPLSLSMPVVAQRHKNSVLAPWLRNLLPDRPEVLARWGREFRVTDQSVFALLRHVGEDVARAAQFVRPERAAEAAVPGPVELLSDEDIAYRLRRLRRDPAAWEPDDEHRTVQPGRDAAEVRPALRRHEMGLADRAHPDYAHRQTGHPGPCRPGHRRVPVDAGGTVTRAVRARLAGHQLHGRARVRRPALRPAASCR